VPQRAPSGACAVRPQALNEETGLCFQDRSGGFEFIVLPEKCPSGRRTGNTTFLHDRWNVEHAYFPTDSASARTPRRRSPAFSSTPLHRIEESREEATRLFGGVATPYNAALVYQRSTSGAQHPLQDDRLARLAVARLLTGKLEPKLARQTVMASS